MQFPIEAASAPPAARRRYLFRGTLLALGFTASFLVASPNGPAGLDPLMLGLNLLCLLGMVYEFAALMRALDELQRQIHLSALAIGGGLAIALTVLWGYADLILVLPDVPVILMGPLAGLLYYVAIYFVRGRYA